MYLLHFVFFIENLERNTIPHKCVNLQRFINFISKTAFSFL